MKIRRMLINDYEKVYQLWTNTDGMGIRSLDDSFEGIEKFLRRNPATNFVAESDNDIIGVILCGNDGRRGYIYHAAVKKEYRRNSIGKALVDAVIDALKREGINKIGLVTFSSNYTGNDFWKSLGFYERTDLVYRNLSINAENV